MLEGVQHNTYDVEFYGPNAMCGVYYLGALRAGEEMAHAVGDEASAREYRRLFESGRKWIDGNLFNGEFYIQKIRGVPLDKIAPSLRSNMGSEGTEDPQYQLGSGCLADQLVGQYMAEVAGLGDLLAGANLRKTLASIYRYNFKRTLSEHNTVQRTYALNDEAATGGLRLRKGGAAADSVSILCGGMDRTRIHGCVAHDVRGHDARGGRDHPQCAGAVRRREAQSVGRAGVRSSLRPGDVGMVGGAGGQRVPVSWRAGKREHGAAAGRDRRVPFVLGERHGVGCVYREWRAHDAAIGPWDAGVPVMQRSGDGRGGEGDGEPQAGRSQASGWGGDFPGPCRAARG